MMYILPMTSTFEIVAEPTRRRILDDMRDSERSVGELVERLQLSQPGCPSTCACCGRRDWSRCGATRSGALYRVRTEPLEEIDAWLAPYRRLWNAKLDALGRHLDEEGT